MRLSQSYRDCKSANVGSIPARTSSIVNNLADHRSSEFGRNDLRRVRRDHLRLCLHNRTWWRRPRLSHDPGGDAVAEVSRETHEAELKTMAQVFADVKMTDEIVAMLSEGVR